VYTLIFTIYRIVVLIFFSINLFEKLTSDITFLISDGPHMWVPPRWIITLFWYRCL